MDRQMSFLETDVKTEKPIPTNEYCDTSVHSRDKINKNHYRVKIYEFISDHGGSTCDEVETGLSLRHQTASCFIRFLTQDGLLKDSGDRRITRAGRKAIVWVTVEA